MYDVMSYFAQMNSKLILDQIPHKFPRYLSVMGSVPTQFRFLMMVNLPCVCHKHL